MTADRCPRLFEAEAMRDGRLGVAERASFERHTKTCAACAREVQSLDALGRTLRETAPGQADELHVRRERTRLLAAFDRELLGPEQRRSASRRRVVWAGAAVGFAAALVVFVAVYGHGAVLGHGRSPSSVTATSGAVVRPDGAAAWSERLNGDRDEVILERGSLWIHVDHRSAHDRRVFVTLPDGELEDTGTTFTIAAEDGHTTRVAVEEGSVVLRVHGEPSVTVTAGETWTPHAPAPSPCATSVTPPPSASPAEPPVASSSAALPTAAASHAVSPLPPPLPADASADFHAATSALDRGDNRAAAAAFAAFLTKHPRDARAEDAAYLRVIALERCGDRGAMKAAASDYLDRYPTGFRHAEVETLSRRSPNPQ